MDRRRIGVLEVSVVGLGANNFGTTFGTPVDLAGTRAVVDAAIDAGVDFIDTADIYGDSEQFLGEVLVGRRERVVLATKFGMRSGGTREAVRSGIDASLGRLRTDRIELFQLHAPDPKTPIEETLGALDEAVRAGKVLEIGCSNFSVEQLEEASDASSRHGLARFVSVQNDLSVLRSKAAQDVLPACERLDMAFIPYSPLASGMLTGKYRRNEAPEADTRLAHLSQEQRDRSLSERTFSRLDRLETFARDRGHTLTELAFGWLLAHQRVASVIAGATKPEQVRANVAAIGWVLSPEEVGEAAELAQG